MKRLVDVVVGSVLILAVLPLIVILAMASAVMFRTWPFFTQVRIGRGGRKFTFVKIRTMPKHAPAYATKDSLDIDLPRLAQWMRAKHIDELPQLFLVIRGHMSLVGPRPKMPDEHEPVNPDWNELRQSVPQGCTCLWQIGQETHLLPSDSPEYDHFYVIHRNLRLDLLILWWTVLDVLGVGKPRALGDIPDWALRHDVVASAEDIIARARRAMSERAAALGEHLTHAVIRVAPFELGWKVQRDVPGHTCAETVTGRREVALEVAGYYARSHPNADVLLQSEDGTWYELDLALIRASARRELLAARPAPQALPA